MFSLTSLTWYMKVWNVGTDYSIFIQYMLLVLTLTHVAPTSVLTLCKRIVTTIYYLIIRICFQQTFHVICWCWVFPWYWWHSCLRCCNRMCQHDRFYRRNHHNLDTFPLLILVSPSIVAIPWISCGDKDWLCIIVTPSVWIIVHAVNNWFAYLFWGTSS